MSNEICQKTDFKGVRHISDTTLMSELESNLKVFFDWGFLRIRGWFDVDTPTTAGPYGGNMAQLRLVDDPEWSSGQVWESARKDWVWETGVDYVGKDDVTYNPNSVGATVLVNGSPTAYDHINYPLGRVYFSSALSSTSTVLAQYAYRWCQVYRANARWWKELQYRSFRVDDSYFTQVETGTWAIGGQHRVQMPCIVIEAVPRTISRGYQLGDGAAWVEQDVICHVIAEHPNDRNKIVDILRGQFDNGIWLFDSNSVSAAEDWPLDYRGEIVDSSKTYPELVDKDTGHRWVLCRFTKTATSEVESFNSRLYEGRVRLTCEVILPD